MKPENTLDINLSNYEEYLLLSLDGELDAATEKALFAFLDAHPELADEVIAFEAVKIPLPGNAPVFEEKEALLQPVAASPKFRKFQPYIWAAAAALLVWFGIRAMQDIPEKTPEIAGVSNGPKAVAVPQPTIISGNNTPASTGEISENQTLPSTPKTATQTASFPEIKTAMKPVSRPAVPENGTPAPQENIAALPIASGMLFPEHPPLPETAFPVAIILPAVMVPESAGLEINIPTLDALREAAAEKVIALREARRDLKNTEATIIVGNRELFTIRF